MGGVVSFIEHSILVEIVPGLGCAMLAVDYIDYKKNDCKNHLIGSGNVDWACVSWEGSLVDDAVECGFSLTE